MEGGWRKREGGGRRREGGGEWEKGEGGGGDVGQEQCYRPELLKCSRAAECMYVGA